MLVLLEALTFLKKIRREITANAMWFLYQGIFLAILRKYRGLYFIVFYAHNLNYIGRFLYTEYNFKLLIYFCLYVILLTINILFSVPNITHTAGFVVHESWYTKWICWIGVELLIPAARIVLYHRVNWIFFLSFFLKFCL